MTSKQKVTRSHSKKRVYVSQCTSPLYIRACVTLANITLIQLL